jgi:predicted acetyltransferase
LLGAVARPLLKQERAGIAKHLPVSVRIRDAQNSAQDRTWIQSQYPEYLEDLSQLSMNTGMFPASGEYGERKDELMARWFADDSSHPLMILHNDKPTGFALVSRPPRNLREKTDFRMAEFFIELRSRRIGIGREAAQLIFNRFEGNWEVTEFLYNRPAVAFWRSIVSQYTNGQYRETVASGEVRQAFSTVRSRSR